MRLFVLFSTVFCSLLQAQGSFETTCSKNIFAEVVCETSETAAGQLRRQNNSTNENSLNDFMEIMRKQQQDNERVQLRKQAEYSCAIGGYSGYNSYTGQCFGALYQKNSSPNPKEIGEGLIDSEINRVASSSAFNKISFGQKFDLKNCMKKYIDVTPQKVASENDAYMFYLQNAKGDKEIIKRLGTQSWHIKVKEVANYCKTFLNLPS